MIIRLIALLLITILRPTELRSQQIGADKHERSTKNVQEPTTQEPKQPTQFESKILETMGRMADQQKAAQEQSDASQKSWDSPAVLINIGLLVVGAVYSLFAWLQWRAISRQADIADRTLAANNRPRLKIRGVRVKEDIFSDPDGKIDVTFDVVNYGHSEAIVLQSDGQIWLRTLSYHLPVSPPYIVPPYACVRGDPRLQPGESRECWIGMYVPKHQSLSYRSGDLVIGILGYIDYRGAVGNQYRTAFCRFLSVERRYPEAGDEYFAPVKFVPVSNADYEHED